MANRRRRRQKPNQMVWIMLAITVVCVVIVFAIVMVQKEKGTLVKQARAVTKDMVYENAYIVSNDDGRLIFICDGELYRAKGTMEESFTGVCDIEISGSKVKKIQIKPDDISGVMLSYGDGTMQIAGQGDIPMQSDKLPVYDETGTSPKEISVSDLIIGSETLSYILDSGRICAIVRRQAPDLTYIRVLIKNDGKDEFPTIAAGAASNLYVDDADCGSNAIDDVGAYMANVQKSKIKVSSADNYVSINGKSYPGSFEFIGTDAGIVAVNTVDVETYVRYVLPSEMPSTFEGEALKAQAVCARTFVYSQMKNTQYALYGANIDNTTAFQVYNASEAKHSTDEAVGVITYLMLCGSLPFDSNDGDEAIARKTVSNPVNMCFGIWKTISKEAKDFIRNTLEKDMNKRITIKTALEDKWFTKYFGKELVNVRKSSMNTTSEFRVYTSTLGTKDNI